MSHLLHAHVDHANRLARAGNTCAAGLNDAGVLPALLQHADMAGADTDNGGAGASVTCMAGVIINNGGEGTLPSNMAGAEALLSPQEFSATWACTFLHDRSGSEIARTQ